MPRLVVVFTYTLSHDLLDTLTRAALDFAANNSRVIAAIDASSIPVAKAHEAIPALAEVVRATGASGVAIFNANVLTEKALVSLNPVRSRHQHHKKPGPSHETICGSHHESMHRKEPSTPDLAG